VGADHVATLPQWRESDELSTLVEFAVIPRPGQAEAFIPAPFRGQTLKGFPLGVSSSQIRARIRSGASVEHLVPSAVLEVIRNERLYLE
jgi:nicotinate-nucleotide adenylyltransferase